MAVISTGDRLGIGIASGFPEDYAAFWPVFRQPFHAVGEPLTVGMGVALLRNGGMLRPEPRVAGWLLASVAASLGALVLSHEFMAEITAYDIVAQPLVIAILFTGALTAATSLIGGQITWTGGCPCRGETRLSALPHPLRAHSAFPLTSKELWAVSGQPTSASRLGVPSCCTSLVEKPCLIASVRPASNEASMLE